MAYGGGALRLIDQRLLPLEAHWIEARDLETVAVAIETMAVRGAPAIGCAAAYALALDAKAAPDGPWAAYAPRFEAGVARLRRTRPTAVNLFYALDKMRDLARAFEAGATVATARPRLEALAQHLFDDDVATCKAIGRHGADALMEIAPRKLRVLTHCNAGGLATAGYGTALGVIRALAERGRIELVYVDETRPWLQGARLTAYELVTEKIPATLITDSTAAYLMQQGKIDCAVVGADRIAANGDTANKIGTYGVAVACKHHGLPFFVAAPRSTFDVSLAGGAAIPVEERSPDEVRTAGGRFVAPAGMPVYNPSFDVTPASLIAGIITEAGVLVGPYRESIAQFADRR